MTVWLDMMLYSFSTFATLSLGLRHFLAVRLSFASFQLKSAGLQTFVTQHNRSTYPQGPSGQNLSVNERHS